MPVQHNYTMKAGTKSKLLLVYATSAESTSGKTGLARNLSAASAAYIREGDSTAHRVPIVQGRVGEWGSGALAEVDPELLPGLYQFGAPDEMLAEGSARAVLLDSFSRDGDQAGRNQPRRIRPPGRGAYRRVEPGGSQAARISSAGIASVYGNGTGIGRASRERTSRKVKREERIVKTYVLRTEERNHVEDAARLRPRRD